MFYSHQILARKGPLATVWMAAHLHHRLKKPHYNSVDINSTIDRIIWPEAPIALRMSGHLLLGVVRIYAKKVDYLYLDCNDAMVKVSKVFTPAEANVTEAPASAPVDEVTLPERYDLDALELEDSVFIERGVDSFVRSPEDITLPDLTPLNMDQYVAVTFEDLDMTPVRSSFRGSGSGRERYASQPATADGTDSSGGVGPGNGTELASEGLPGANDSGFQPMEEDTHPVRPVDISERLDAAVADQGSTPETRGFIYPGPSHQPEATAERICEHQSPQSIEVMRHAALDSPLPDLPLPFPTADETERQKADASGKEKEFVSPMGEEMLESGGQPTSFQPQNEQMDAAILEESPNLFGHQLSFGNGSVNLSIRSTPSVPQMQVPPVEVAPRRTKRKLYDVRAIVLSNKALKSALNDTSKILRKKQHLPGTFIGSWRLEKIVRKEQIFTGPLLAGMSEDLHDICTDLSAKPHLAIEELTQEARDMNTPERVLQPDVSQGIETQQVEGETEGDLNTQTEQEGDTLISTDVQATPAPDRVAGHSPRSTSDRGSGEGGKGEEFPVSPPELDMEIERLRRDEGDVGTSMIPELTTTPVLHSPTMGSRDEGDVGTSMIPELTTTPVLHSPTMGSPIGRDEMPAVSAGSSKSGQEVQSSGLFPTPDLASSAETLGPELETVAPSEPHQIRQPSFSDVPELITSPGPDELRFLDVDSSIPELSVIGTRGTPNGDLSVRASSAVQYLKNKLSPGTPSSGDESAIFSLNDILQGQPRKRCARMFYETLVLKTKGRIDVEQNESYGDITLKLTPAFKAQS